MPRHKLANLSDNVLLSRLHELVKNEKQTTLSILRHLAEVDRRDLYLAYGFSSLFDYCVGALGYSRSAAGRRIASARCLRRFPEVYSLLESGEVTLCTVGLVAPVLDDENKDLVLLEIRKKTQRQVETIVARYKPPVAYRDRVRPVRVAVPQVGQNSKNSRNPLILNSRSGSAHRTNCGIVDPSAHTVGVLPSTVTDSTLASGACAAAEPQDPAKPAGAADNARSLFGGACAAAEPQNPARPTGGSSNATPLFAGEAARIERRLLIQFLANEAFMEKLDEVKSLLSNKMPGGTFENVFDVLMDEFIDHHSPEKRSQRREKRRSKKATKQNEKQAGISNSKSGCKHDGQRAEDRNGKRDAAEQMKDDGAANKPPNKSQETQGATSPQKGHLVPTSPKPTRHIPASIRDKVFARDDARCTYLGKNGKRCGSTHSLQIDHRKPFARGGKNTLSNLRLLCGRHNRLEARRILGANVMNQYNRRE